MKAEITLSLAIVFGAIGDVLLSKGMQQNGEVHIRSIRDIPPLLKFVFTRPYILAGVCVMALYFCSYAASLAWVDVSVANPITALSYVITTAYAVAFLKERVGTLRWAGVALITLGAICVGLSS